MTRPRAPYPAAFRQQMVDLVRSSRSPEALAREFDPTVQAIRNWVNSIQRYLVTVTLYTLDLGAFSFKNDCCTSLKPYFRVEGYGRYSTDKVGALIV